MARPTTRRDASGRYLVTWRDPIDGKRRQRAVERLSTAQILTAARTGRAAPNPPTVADLCQLSITNRALAASTTTRMRAITRVIIAPFFGDRAAADITRAEVTRWITWLTSARGYTPRSARTAFRLLANATAWAAQTRLLAADPCLGVSPPRLPKPLTEREATGGRPPLPATAGAVLTHSHPTDPLTQLRRAMRDGASSAQLYVLLSELPTED